MGSSISAIYDDERDWSDFKIQAGIVGTDWKLYSPEYNLAHRGLSLGYTKKRLKLFVNQEKELIDLREKHKKELVELAQLEALEQKYK
jgi:hypothetical protein